MLEIDGLSEDNLDEVRKCAMDVVANDESVLFDLSHAKFQLGLIGLKVLTSSPHTQKTVDLCRELLGAANTIGQVIELARGTKRVLGIDELTNLLLENKLDPRDYF